MTLLTNIGGSENKSSEKMFSRIMWGGLVAVTLAGLYAISSEHPTHKVPTSENPTQLIKIIKEDRNNDGLLDIVEKYSNGEEKCLYAFKDVKGNIFYK